ncbi:unnamed protein product [Amoebophrya sp. A120]|nr:unnamed protein product [Amoebophrya sp. A120]|eukprot:GSA120T00004828001.1
MVMLVAAGRSGRNKTPRKFAKRAVAGGTRTAVAIFASLYTLQLPALVDAAGAASSPLLPGRDDDVVNQVTQGLGGMSLNDQVQADYPVMKDITDVAIYILDNSASMWSTSIRGEPVRAKEIDYVQWETHEEGEGRVFQEGQIPGCFTHNQQWLELVSKTEQIARYNVRRRMPALYIMLNGKKKNVHQTRHVSSEREQNKDYVLILPTDNETENTERLKELRAMIDSRNVYNAGGTPLVTMTRALGSWLFRSIIPEADPRNQIFADSLLQDFGKLILKRAKDVTVVFVTDGMPGDGSVNQFHDAMQDVARWGHQNRISFLFTATLCTECREVVNEYNALDERVKGLGEGRTFKLDVIDDFFGEALEVAKKNPAFVYSFQPIHEARQAGWNAPKQVGDNLDEKALSLVEMELLALMVVRAAFKYDNQRREFFPPVDSANNRWPSPSSREGSSRANYRWLYELIAPANEHAKKVFNVIPYPEQLQHYSISEPPKVGFLESLLLGSAPPKPGYGREHCQIKMNCMRLPHPILGTESDRPSVSRDKQGNCFQDRGRGLEFLRKYCEKGLVSPIHVDLLRIAMENANTTPNPKIKFQAPPSARDSSSAYRPARRGLCNCRNPQRTRGDPHLPSGPPLRPSGNNPVWQPSLPPSKTLTVTNRLAGNAKGLQDVQQPSDACGVSGVKEEVAPIRILSVEEANNLRGGSPVDPAGDAWEELVRAQVVGRGWRSRGTTSDAPPSREGPREHQPRAPRGILP